MKWVFELSETPMNPDFPIEGIQIFQSGAKKGPYYFTLHEFIETFQARDEINKREQLIFESSPTLPNGTIRYMHNKDKSVFRFFIELPKRVWGIRYDNEKTLFPIGFPRLLVKYDVTACIDAKYFVSNMEVFSVLNDGMPITEDTQLYFFPYPNVYKGTGAVCMGANERIQLSCFTELERSFVYFAQSPFNEDLGICTTLGIGNFRKFIELYQGQAFNDDWLLPIENFTAIDVFNK